jgi:5-methylcytosine-specific restriction endonuclease McrA
MAIDTSGLKFPKPGHAEGLVKLSPAKYRKHKQEVWDFQNRRCGKCGAYLAEASVGHLHHTRKGGRGMGGSHRNDLETLLLCESCHHKIHNQGSRR